VFLSGINSSKRVEKTWKMMKEVIIQDLTEPVKMFKNCGVWCIHIDVVSISYGCATNFDNETVVSIEKGLKFALVNGFSIMTMLQLTWQSVR
jgi:hypothetical protein